LLAVIVCIAVGGTSGCSVEVRGKRRALIDRDRIRGQLKLSVEQRTEELSSAGSKTESESQIMKQELILFNQGRVFDEKFMSYRSSIGIGLTQQTYQSNANSGTSEGQMTSHNLNMNFLPEKTYPFSINTSRGEHLISRKFQGPLRVTDSSAGFGMRLRKFPAWPMTFSVTTSEVEQTSDIGSNDSSYVRSTDRLGYTLRHDFSQRSQMNFRTDISKLAQQGTGVQRVDQTARHRLTHNFKFGKNWRHNLGTSVSFLERTGDIESKTTDLMGNLKMVHSRTLFSFYNTSLSESTFRNAQVRALSALAGLNHQLYQNLNTTVSMSTRKSEFGDSGESTSNSTNLKLNYKRNNPWGVLTSKYSHRMTIQEFQGDNAIGTILGESHVFKNDKPFMLDNTNIDISTIVVTNADGTIIYKERDDYYVFEVGDQVQIEPTIFGSEGDNIVDDQELLVDYSYSASYQSDGETINQRFKLEQKFNNGLTVYFHRDSKEKKRNFTGRQTSEDGYITNSFGASFVKNHYSFSAERGKTTSNLNSVESTRFSAGVNLPWGSKTTVSGKLSYSTLESSGVRSRETTILKAQAKIKRHLTRQFKLAWTGEFREEENSELGTITGTRFGVALEYRYRAVTAKLSWDSYFLERFNTERNYSRIYASLIRKF
jgi:hypothetical protein